jgi:TRAP-type C4-dicarboxylate transport system permease small subunit
MGLMVLIIMLQVVFRYILGNALAWPDEGARFLMLWMTALIAPTAYRWGGFVSIEMVKDLLPARLGRLAWLAAAAGVAGRAGLRIPAWPQSHQLRLAVQFELAEAAAWSSSGSG